MKQTLFVLATVVGIAGVAGLQGCQDSTAPLQNVEVAVDSAVYHAQAQASWVAITVTATITNNSNHDVYLGQQCGYYHVARPAGDTTTLLLGSYACTEEQRIAPLVITSGSTYSRTFTLIGSTSVQTSPPILPKHNSGMITFGHALSSDGKTFETINSPAFLVNPPGT